MGEGDDSQVSFEKHKIFLYKEDFGKFMAGLEQAINFINQNQEYTEDSESEEKSNLKVNRRLQFWIAKSKLTLILNN